MPFNVSKTSYSITAVLKRWSHFYSSWDELLPLLKSSVYKSLILVLFPKLPRTGQRPMESASCYYKNTQGDLVEKRKYILSSREGFCSFPQRHPFTNLRTSVSPHLPKVPTLSNNSTLGTKPLITDLWENAQCPTIPPLLCASRSLGYLIAWVIPDG